MVSDEDDGFCSRLDALLASLVAETVEVFNQLLNVHFVGQVKEVILTDDLAIVYVQNTHYR